MIYFILASSLISYMVGIYVGKHFKEFTEE